MGELQDPEMGGSPGLSGECNLITGRSYGGEPFPAVGEAVLMEGRSERCLAAGLGDEAGSQEPRNAVASGRWKRQEECSPANTSKLAP